MMRSRNAKSHRIGDRAHPAGVSDQAFSPGMSDQAQVPGFIMMHCVVLTGMMFTLAWNTLASTERLIKRCTQQLDSTDTHARLLRQARHVIRTSLRKMRRAFCSRSSRAIFLCGMLLLSSKMIIAVAALPFLISLFSIVLAIKINLGPVTCTPKAKQQDNRLPKHARKQLKRWTYKVQKAIQREHTRTKRFIHLEQQGRRKTTFVDQIKIKVILCVTIVQSWCEDNDAPDFGQICFRRMCTLNRSVRLRTRKVLKYIVNNLHASGVQVLAHEKSVDVCYRLKRKACARNIHIVYHGSRVWWQTLAFHAPWFTRVFMQSFIVNKAARDLDTLAAMAGVLLVFRVHCAD